MPFKHIQLLLQAGRSGASGVVAAPFVVKVTGLGTGHALYLILVMEMQRSGKLVMLCLVTVNNPTQWCMAQLIRHFSLNDLALYRTFHYSFIKVLLGFFRKLEAFICYGKNRLGVLRIGLGNEGHSYP